VAEVALNRVSIETGAGGELFLECEIELQLHGSEADLRELPDLLKERWQLRDETDSKFAGGLALVSSPVFSASGMR
jgi:inorganic triphosphatase YgiF